MSTLLEKMFWEFFGVRKRLRSGPQVFCALCRGGLHPGEHDYLLEGRRVCGTCLERYAQRYFAHQRRRLGHRGGRTNDDL